MIGGRSSSDRESKEPMMTLSGYFDDTSITMSRSKNWDLAAGILSVWNLGLGTGEVSEGDVENSGGEFDLVEMDSVVVRQLQPTEDELTNFPADNRELVRLLPGFCCFDDFLSGGGTGCSGGDGGGELMPNPSLDSSSLVK